MSRSICTFPKTINVDVCAPDTGPPVPATWTGPQPENPYILGYATSGFFPFTGCLCTPVPITWLGELPVISSTPYNNGQLTTTDLHYFDQSFVWPFPPTGENIGDPSRGVQVQISFVPSTSWIIEVYCINSPFPRLWSGTKLVGLDPLGTYMSDDVSSPLRCIVVGNNPTTFWNTLSWSFATQTTFGTETHSASGNTFTGTALKTTNDANPAHTVGCVFTGSALYTGPVFGAKLTTTGVLTGASTQFQVRVNGNLTANLFGLLGEQYFLVQDTANPGLQITNKLIEFKYNLLTATFNVPINATGILT